MDKEKDQVDSAVEEKSETKQEEAVELTEDQQVEQVKNLLSPDSKEESEESDETESEEESQDESEEETQEETEEEVEPVISDEIIEQFPTLKMYRGKPLKELAPSYDKLVRKLHETIQKNKELTGKLEKTSLTELGEPPDPIENRKEFDEWLKKRDELVKSQVKTEPEPTVNPMAEVQKRLPEGTDINKVADEWAKFNAPRLFDATGALREDMQRMYRDDPDLMVNEIVSFYDLLSKAQQNDLSIEKKAKEETYKQTKQAFKKARETKKESSQTKAVKRTVDSTPEDQMLANIFKYAEEGQI